MPVARPRAHKVRNKLPAGALVASWICLLSVGLIAPVTVSAQELRVTLLGTGTPNPHPERFGSATLVEAGSQRLLFDAGRGGTIRLNQLGIPMREVT